MQERYSTASAACPSFYTPPRPSLPAQLSRPWILLVVKFLSASLPCIAAPVQQPEDQSSPSHRAALAGHSSPSSRITSSGRSLAKSVSVNDDARMLAARTWQKHKRCLPSERPSEEHRRHILHELQASEPRIALLVPASSRSRGAQGCVFARARKSGHRAVV